MPSSAGLPFNEVVSVTRFEAGIADNVIPDLAVATRQLPLRAGPHAGGAPRSYLEALVGGRAEVEVTGDSPPGEVVVANPLVEALVGAGAHGVEPKQAWTNVADFTSRGHRRGQLRPGSHRSRASP